MENWRPSDLSWSYSQKNHIESCRRHYFYHRFWGQDAKLRWKLYEMRNISTLSMLGGQVAHMVIAEALKSVQAGANPTAQESGQQVINLMRSQYFESARKLWHVDNRPKDRKMSSITNLMEHYYHFPDVFDRAHNAGIAARDSVKNLIESELWQEIIAVPGQWAVVEEEGFPHFDLDGIKIFSKIDFAHTIDEPTIVDWKTGQQKEQDRRQVVLYAMYAAFRWGWDPLETRLQVVYLNPSLNVISFRPTQADIDLVTEDAKTSFGQMRDLEPAFGPADISQFPISDNAWECRWCRFQGICEGANRLEGKTGSDEEGT